MIFLTFIAMLLTDLVTGFGLLLPRLAPWLRLGALGVGALLSLIAVIQGMRPPVVREYEVHLRGLPQEMDGTVLVAVSDLHLGSLIGERWLEARLAQVRTLDPDMVALLGDIFEGHGRAQGRLLELLGDLSAPLGVWGVHGNHESYGRRRGGNSAVEEAGVEVLRNRWIQVQPGLVVAGVDDLSPRRAESEGRDMVIGALSGRPDDATVFLSHRPLQAETAADEGVGLMLSGHTHAGQVWPFGYLVQREYPYLAGRYEVGQMTLIVCRGTGTWGPRMRLWRPGEILKVTLRSAERDAGSPSPAMAAGRPATEG